MDNDDAREAAIKARLCYDFVLKAIGNNNGDAWDEVPMPQPGAVHASIHNAAVKIAKSKWASLHPQDVIGDGNWDVLVDILHQPVRRIAHAYMICRNDKGEDFSYDVWFCQNYNKAKRSYEPLIPYGICETRLVRIKK